MMFLPDFLPGPVPLLHSEQGIIVSKVENERSFYGSLSLRLSLKVFEPRICEISPQPFDWSCPSLQDKVRERVCNVCMMYFCSKKAVGSHKKSVHFSTIESILETIEFVVQQCYEEEDEEIPVITDMMKWLQSPFETCAMDE